MNNSVLENSTKHSPVELNKLICTAYFDLHSAQKEYYRAVESSQKDITLTGKSLPVYTEWLLERSDHILNALELLGDDLQKIDYCGLADDETDSFNKNSG